MNSKIFWKRSKRRVDAKRRKISLIDCIIKRATNRQRNY